MKIEMKINEISSKVLSKVKSQLYYRTNIEFEKNIGRKVRDLEETFMMACIGLSLDSL